MNEKSGATPPPVSPDVSWPLPGSIDRPDYAPGERETLIAEIKDLLREKDISEDQGCKTEGLIEGSGITPDAF